MVLIVLFTGMAQGPIHPNAGPVGNRCVVHLLFRYGTDGPFRRWYFKETEGISPAWLKGVHKAGTLVTKMAPTCAKMFVIVDE